jgi:3-deoxy-7-phosphoheptulonate synthase
MMIESNVKAGSQPFKYGETRKEDLDPYISITDACIGWDETEELILSAYNQLKSS